MSTSELRLPSSSYVAGEWVGNGASVTVQDPATETILGELGASNEADVDRALTAAESALGEWRSKGAWHRSEVLRQIATILRNDAQRAAAILTGEQGKPLREAEWEVRASADQFDWYADEARRIYGRTVDAQNPADRIVVRREPVGVVAAFSAWNFPMLLSARKIAPALAAGCPVVISPSPEAPYSTLLLAEAAERAGIPNGLLSVLVGDPAAISGRLLNSSVVRKLTLTGSVPVGQLLLRQAADGVKNVSMELGGHAPVIVFSDADVDRAAAACAAGKFRNAGQVCASPSRFIVHESVVERFQDAFSRIANEIVVGDGRDADSEMGPLANARRVLAAEELIAEATAKGARVAAGGGREKRHHRGHFFRPTVLADVTSDMAIMTEEPFVPVAPVIPFASTEEALDLANSTPFALASYLFSNDLRTVTEVSEGLQAGMVGVNTMALAAAEAPFGGNKLSGFGREGGSEGILDYLVTKYVRIAV